MAKSHVIKRSIIVAGPKASISMEDAFWSVLKDAATGAGRTLSDLATELDAARAEGANLSSAIRLFVLNHALTTRSA